MIELRNISKTYTSSAQSVLKNINLTIPDGEIFGIIGRSGAGKSTLVHCINMLERPTTGDIFIDNEALGQLSAKDLRQARRKIGMIFQHFNLLRSRTVYDNAALPLELAGLSRKEIDITITPLLELVGLQDKKKFYPGELSGGQKQRVAIARALANKPSLLLSDEATSALDPETTRSILQLLQNINQQLKLTIILITHEMEIVKQICNRIALLHEGEIIEQANSLDFFIEPKTAIAKEFVNSSLYPELPSAFKGILISHNKDGNSSSLLRVAFRGQATGEPIIANLIRTFCLDINILQAKIESIRDEIFGVMLIEIAGASDDMEKSIIYLRQAGLTVEHLGYVPATTR